MKINSRFTKVAVAAGLVVATGAGVLGLTGFASAQVARSNSAVVAKSDRPSPIADAAKVLGMTEAELKTELEAGKSIADVAKAKNIDLDTVIAKLTAAFKAHLDEEVASGEPTQAEADAKLAEFKTRLDDMVNGVRPVGGKGGHGPEGKGGHGGRGHGGRHGDMPGAPAQGSASQGA